MNHLNFRGTNHISGIAEAGVVRFCVTVCSVKS